MVPAEIDETLSSPGRSTEYHEGPRRAGSRARRSSVPSSVWLVTAVWGALLLGASLVWPVPYGYDEASHVDMAYAYSVHPFRFYGPGKLSYSVGDTNMQQRLLPGIPPRQRFAVAPIATRSQRPTLAQLGGPKREVGGAPDQMVQHPPLYYWMEAIVMRVPGVSSLSWDVEIWLMRLLSIVIVLPVPFLCWYTTRRLLGRSTGSDPPSGRRGHWAERDVARTAVLAAVIPLTIPNLIRDSASVDNDALLLLTTSVVIALSARVVTGDLSRRTAVGVAIALAAALWTKGFGLILPVPIVLAYVYGWWRYRTGRRDFRSLLTPVAIAAAGGLAGSFWWIRNLIDYGTVQTDGYGTFTAKLFGTATNNGTVGHFIRPFLGGFVSRIWGGIGIPDHPSLGQVVVYGWPLVVALGLIAAVVVRGSPGGRLRSWILLSVSILTIAIVAEGSYSTFHKFPAVGVRGNQGRYLYSTIVAVAGVAAIGWSRVISRRILAWAVPTVLSLAVITNAAAWILILRSWYQPLVPASRLRGFENAVHGLLRWSPLPYGITVLLVFVLPVLTGITAVVVLSRDAVRATPDAPGQTMPRQLAEATS